MMKLSAKFGNIAISSSNRLYVNTTKSKLNIAWNGLSGKYYTIQLKNTKNNEIFVFQINIPGEYDQDENSSGFDSIEPSYITEPGTYEIILYEQTEWLPEIKKGAYYGLSLLESITFIVYPVLTDKFTTDKFSIDNILSHITSKY